MTPEEAFIQATKFRAKAYYYLYEELSKDAGNSHAFDICSRAIYKLGIDKSKTFKKESENSAEILAEEFVKDDIGRSVFAQKILNGNKNESCIEMKKCPLVDMWKDMDLSAEMIQKLCDIAHQIDFGTIEGKGFKLNFRSRISYSGDSCILEIHR
jgi:hypothetical protein